MRSVFIPSCLPSSFASSRSSFGVNSAGIRMPNTESLPSARTHSSATTLLSTPPLNPTTTPSALASLTIFLMKLVISFVTLTGSILRTAFSDLPIFNQTTLRAREFIFSRHPLSVSLEEFIDRRRGFYD